MFSFIGRWFKRNKEEPVAEGLEAPYKKGDPIPYSLNFSLVTEIRVSVRDCQRENVVGVEQVILRPEEIRPIVKLLKALDVKGTRPLDMNPCAELVMTGYNNDERPIAQVMMYDGQLKLENNLFLAHNERLEAKQAELYNLVNIELD